MKIVIIFLLSVALFNFTMVRAMNVQAANNPTNSDREENPSQELSIIIRKVINDTDQYKDVVEGDLYRFETVRPHLDHEAFGHVIFKLKNGTKFAASLQKIEGYQYSGHDGPDNCQRTRYRCGVARKGYPVRKISTLSHYTQGTTLRGGTLRIEFINHLGVLFVGETKDNTPEDALPFKKRKTNFSSGPGSSHNDPIFLDL